MRDACCQPVPIKPESRSFLVRAATWFVGIALFVTVLTWGVAELSRSMRIEQTQRELGQLQRMLEQYKSKHGQYPAVYDNATLLRCLLGRADPQGAELAQPQPWFVTGAQLYFRWPDPTARGNEIVDPWGTPYVYVNYLPINTNPDGYLLLSAGPDRRYSDPFSWLAAADGRKPEDADNLWVSTQQHAPGEP